MATPLRRQFLLFCVAGVMGLVVDSAVLYATAPALGWYGARLLSFACAATTTWAFNRRLTFASPVGTFKQYLRYMASMLLGGGVNYAIYAATLKGFGLPLPTVCLGLTVGPWLGLVGVALGSVGGLLFNFASARYWVFASAVGTSAPDREA